MTIVTKPTTIREFIEQLEATARVAGGDLQVVMEDPFMPGFFHNIEIPIVSPAPDNKCDLLIIK